MIEIKFIYLIQSTLGVLLFLYGLRMMIIGYIHIVRSGIKSSKIIFIVSDVILTFSGFILAYLGTNFRTLLYFCLTYILYKIIVKIGYVHIKMENRKIANEV